MFIIFKIKLGKQCLPNLQKEKNASREERS